MPPVRIARKLTALAIPTGVAVAAFLQAQAIGALVDGSAPPPEAVAAYAETRRPTSPPEAKQGAESLATHDPFEHRSSSPGGGHATCDVRVVFAVSAEHDELSFAAIERDGKSHLRARGGAVGDLRVAAITPESVLFERADGSTCSARVFAGAAPKKVAASPTLTGVPGIVRISATSFEIDRSVVERLLDGPIELGKTAVVRDDRGARIVRVREGSMLAQLGFESGDRLVAINGIDLTSPEKMLELYARMRGGALGHITVRVEREGRTLDLDFHVV